MKPGDVVPNFTLTDHNGQTRSFDEFVAQGPVVVFFYPAAMSKGCTTQSCRFRDLAAEFDEVDASRIGISGDSVEKQKEFAAVHNFDYPLLADVDGEVAQLFGVHRRFGPLRTKRQTFVIDRDRKVLNVIKSELNFAKHADEALETLRQHAR